MNQQQQEPKPRLRTRLKRFAQVYPRTMEYLNDESDQANTYALAEQMRQSGVNEELIPFFVKEVAPVLRTAAQDAEAAAKLNRAILGGISVLNLILLPLLGTTGRGDFPLALAWVTLVCSLPCTAAALYLSTMEGKIKNLKFPLIYAIVFWIALLGCGIATTAFIWHQWNVAGWLFASLTAVLFVICLFYESIQRLRRASAQVETQQTAGKDTSP